MPPFSVRIDGKPLEDARVALNGAGIETIGPPFVRHERRGREAPAEEVPHLVAVLDANTPGDAEARVREQLPRDGDYTVEPGRPLEEGL
jgi:hypothetical protein